MYKHSIGSWNIHRETNDNDNDNDNHPSTITQKPIQHSLFKNVQTLLASITRNVYLEPIIRYSIQPWWALCLDYFQYTSGMDGRYHSIHSSTWPCLHSWNWYRQVYRRWQQSCLQCRRYAYIGMSTKGKVSYAFIKQAKEEKQEEKKEMGNLKRIKNSRFRNFGTTFHNPQRRNWWCWQYHIRYAGPLYPRHDMLRLRWSRIDHQPCPSWWKSHPRTHLRTRRIWECKLQHSERPQLGFCRWWHSEELLRVGEGIRHQSHLVKCVSLIFGEFVCIRVVVLLTSFTLSVASTGSSIIFCPTTVEGGSSSNFDDFTVGLGWSCCGESPSVT